MSFLLAVWFVQRCITHLLFSIFLLGHFTTIYDDLLHVMDLVNDNLRDPLDLDILKCDFAIIKDKWVDLGQFGEL